MFDRLFRHTRIILFSIILLAAVLRLWNLGNVPPSPSMDEASIAYNAYSILKTGGDEYGELPILSHRSYDDYRRAAYLYLAMPFIGLFGLDAVSIRLPAVILSVLTVWAVYHIVLLLFSKHSEFSNLVALLTSFFLAISPWHIYISRLGHESNAYLSFFIFGVLFFLKGERQKSVGKLFISGVFLTLSMISYYAGQALVPLFIIGLFFIFRQRLFSIFQSKKIMFFILIFFIALSVPILRGVFSPDALIRFQGTSIFNSQSERTYEYALKRAQALEKNNFLETAFYDRRILMATQIAEGYISHFRSEWLFANSGVEPHKVSNMGLLYLWDAPFIIVGIILLVFRRIIDIKMKLLVFLWFFLAALPASIATQAPHAMRAYTFLPIWQLFAALGLAFTFFKLLKPQRFHWLGFFIIVGYLVISLLTFSKNYFIVFPRDQSDSFHYALSKAVPYILSEKEKYRKIVFSNRDNLYQSYMVFLFHSRYDPALYQSFGGTRSGGFAESHEFDIYEFRAINLKEEMMEDNVLYVVNPQEAPYGSTAFKTFNNLNGEETIKIFRK